MRARVAIGRLDQRLAMAVVLVATTLIALLYGPTATGAVLLAIANIWVWHGVYRALRTVREAVEGMAAELEDWRRPPTQVIDINRNGKAAS